MKPAYYYLGMRIVMAILFVGMTTSPVLAFIFKKDNKYVVKIEISTNGLYSHNVNGFVGSVDWGDGTVTEYQNPINNPVHYYEGAGEYLIVAEGKTKQLDSSFATCVITEVVHIGGDMGIENMDYAFMGQRNLKTLKEDVFDELKNVRSFYFTFGIIGHEEVKAGYVFHIDGQRNGGLEAIPAGLFDECTEVVNFGCAFYGCNIKDIPAGLFDENTKVRNFGATFSGTDIESVPMGLFDNNKLVENFRYTFYDCRKLRGYSPFTVLVDENGQMIRVAIYDRNKYAEEYSIPIGYQDCFTNCFGLADYGDIPMGWK